MKSNPKKLVLAIIIPLAVGALSAYLTKDNMIMFDYIEKPAFAPPALVFPAAWSVLYALMGIASYLVYIAAVPEKRINSALTSYTLQLVFNFAWTIIFFNIENFLLAFVWLCAMLLLIIITTLRFFSIRRAAGYLMLPYILWTVFAGVLNYSIYILN